MRKGPNSRCQWFWSIAFAALLHKHFTNDVVTAEPNEDLISASWCPDAFYNFGDSTSDTGNGVHFNPVLDHARHLPYGEAFFGRPTGRFCNGRLVIDFILMSFKRPLLTPSWSVAATETRGMNFAFAGATAARIPGASSCLEDQLAQFVGWKALAEKSTYLSGGDLSPSKKLDFSSALFIVDAGGNDLLYSALNDYQYDDLFLLAGPALIKAIVTTIQSLYLEGARKFLVPNVPPEGCLPSSFSLMSRYGIEVDTLGCLDPINNFNRAVNEAIHRAVIQVREAIPDAKIIYFDKFAVFIEVLNNPAKFGFDPEVVPTACCGAPGVGDYNFNISHWCGSSGFTVCKDAEKYISWDGLHYTEHYYRILAKSLLSGVYSDPPTNLTALCGLTFENFGPGVTYEDVYLPTSGSSSAV